MHLPWRVVQIQEESVDNLVLLRNVHTPAWAKIPDEELALGLPFVGVLAQNEGVVAHEVDGHHRLRSAYISI